jgi:hypothetical protein
MGVTTDSGQRIKIVPQPLTRAGPACVSLKRRAGPPTRFRATFYLTLHQPIPDALAHHTYSTVMPPRKKAAAAAAGTDAADATPAPARRSGRNKAPVAADAAADAAPAAAPVSKSKKAPAKAKGKRTRADDEDDADDDEADAKPSQKKKAKAAAVKDDDDADDMAVDDKPEQKKMVSKLSHVCFGLLYIYGMHRSRLRSEAAHPLTSTLGWSVSEVHEHMSTCL